MGEKQLHELQRRDVLSPDDRVLVSAAADDASYFALAGALPFRAHGAGATTRTIADKLGERVSVADFGAVGDGVADDTAAFRAAFASGAATVFAPRGTYRITETLDVGENMLFEGAGRAATLLAFEGLGPLLRARASGLELRGAIRSFAIDLGSGSGLEVTGNQVDLSDLYFFGGAPDGWAIELINSNIVTIERVVMGGHSADPFTANGILWRNGDPANNAVNYGDGVIRSLDIKLGSPNTTGVHLLGEETNLLNNVLIAKAAIVAPEAGPAPFAGTVAARMESCARITMLSCDFEAIEKGVVESAIYANKGASVGNQYFGVFTLNCPTPYEDSNATLARSVQQRTFFGCDNFPGAIGGVSLTDGDSIVPAGLWLQSYVTGGNAVRLRSINEGAMRIDDGAEDGGLEVLVGGNNPQLQPVENGGAVDFYLGKSNIRGVTLQPTMRLFALAASPAGATDGVVAYADGASWDPGSGGGLYLRRGTQWRPMSGGEPITITGDASVAGERAVTFAGDAPATLTITDAIAPGGAVAVLNAGTADLTLAVRGVLTLSGVTTVPAGGRASLVRFDGDRLDAAIV